MSSDAKNRSFNKSPLPKPNNFSAFLEPSPRPQASPLNTFSTRTESPSNKSFKTPRVSPAPTNLASKLELSEKQNTMLKERNKAISLEKQMLQKKLTKDKNSPLRTYKDHAISLIKQTYTKTLQNPSEQIESLKEKVSNIKKLINWISTQPPETEFKFIKMAFEDIQNKFKGFEIDFEAKLSYMEQSHLTQIKKLEKIIFDLEQKQEYETQDTLSVLIKKNNELLKNCHFLSMQNEEFKKNIGQLVKEVERLQRPEVQLEMQEKVIEEYKVQVYLGKKKEDQEIASSLLELEDRFMEVKRYSEVLEEEIKNKNKVIQGCYKEIAEMKVKVIKSKVREECLDKGVRSFSGDRNKPRIIEKKVNKQEIDLLPFFTCLAAALEDFLI